MSGNINYGNINDNDTYVYAVFVTFAYICDFSEFFSLSDTLILLLILKRLERLKMRSILILRCCVLLYRRGEHPNPTTKSPAYLSSKFFNFFLEFFYFSFFRWGYFSVIYLYFAV